MRTLQALILSATLGFLGLSACQAPSAGVRAPQERRDAQCEAPSNKSVATGIVFLHSRPLPPWERGGNVYTGAGAVLDARGHVLTAHHLVEYAKVIEVFPVRIEEHGWAVTSSHAVPMRIVAVAPEEDMVILEPAPDKLHVTPMRIASEMPDEGEAVYSLLHRSGWKSGTVTNVDYPLPEFTAMMETDIRTVGGDSGSPLVDNCGRLIGILSKGRDNGTRSYFVPVDVALQELQFTPQK